MGRASTGRSAKAARKVSLNFKTRLLFRCWVSPPPPGVRRVRAALRRREGDEATRPPRRRRAASRSDAPALLAGEARARISSHARLRVNPGPRFSRTSRRRAGAGRLQAHARLAPQHRHTQPLLTTSCADLQPSASRQSGARRPRGWGIRLCSILINSISRYVNRPPPCCPSHPRFFFAP